MNKLDLLLKALRDTAQESPELRQVAMQRHERIRFLQAEFARQRAPYADFDRRYLTPAKPKEAKPCAG